MNKVWRSSLSDEVIFKCVEIPLFLNFNTFISSFNKYWRTWDGVQTRHFRFYYLFQHKLDSSALSCRSSSDQYVQQYDAPCFIGQLKLSSMYIYFTWVYGGFFVHLYPLNVKTAEPSGLNFCVGPHMATGKFYECSEF